MMKKNKKLLALLLTATAGLTLAGCNLIPGTPSSSDTSTESSMTQLNELTLSDPSMQLITGNSKALTASLIQNGVEVEDFEVEWSTSNPGVATVENGVVTAVSAGTATITATVGELSATCTVSVSDPVTLSISEETLDLFEDETATLTVTASDGNEYDVVWNTSDPSVATVENGVVTAVGAGTATITASIDSTSVTCEVTVYEKIVTMYLSQSSANLKVGEDLEIKAYLSDGSSPAITWTSSQEGVATVENGVVTAIGAGTTTITATVDDLSATCEITVTDSYEIILSEITSEGELFVGDSVTLNIVAKKNGVEQDLSEVTLSGEGFTAEGNVITLTKSGLLTVTAEYHGETMERTVGCYANVATKDEFLAIANNLSGWYKLTADLDFGGAKLTAFSSWNGNEVAGVAFTGIFDGQGYSISNFVTNYNQTWNSADRDRSVFGHMKDGAIVRNVAFLGVETADRAHVVASYVEADAGCLIENVYVEAYYGLKGSYGINMSKDNPAAFFVGKLNAGNTIKNCVLNLDIYETVFNDINTFNASTGGKAAFQAAFVGINNGTIENCQVLYNAHPGQDLGLTYSGEGEIINSAIYATPVDLWKNADLSGFDSEIWTIVEDSIPHIGYLGADVTVETTAVEVPLGGTYQINANCDSAVAYVALTEGLTVDANGLVTVATTANAGDELKVKVYCAYDATKCAEITITVGDKVEATAVESVSFDNIVTGANYVNEVELNVSVKVNDVAVDTYTVISGNEQVVKVVDGKAVAVANGTTNIFVKMGDATVLTIPVSITNCYVAITTVEEFEAIYNNQKGYYRLMNDIDFQGATHHAFGSWKYGHDDTSYSFQGIFDGNGYAIKNVVIGNDNRHEIVQNDRSLFGTIHLGGIVKNLSVIGAEIGGWGGVIASGVGANGTIENCYVEVTVTGTENVALRSDIGALCFRAQANSHIRNCISVVSIADGVDTTYVGAVIGMNLSSDITNCHAIVATGEDMSVYTSEHATVKPGPLVNSAVSTSVADFYANVDLTQYTSDLWKFEEGEYPHMGTQTADISLAEEAIEVPVGTSKNVSVSSGLAYIVSSDTAGVTFKNGTVYVDETVAAGTTATITFTCAYDKTSTATLTVTVANAVSATAGVASISEDIYVGETMDVNLGVEVKVNDQAVTEGYEIKSSNVAVVTVANGVATLVGDGSANITVEKDGAILLTIPVSVSAYHKITTTEEFLAMGKDSDSMAKKYKLANDLDFGGAKILTFTHWAAQNADNSLRWRGIFDGNGYSVSNFNSYYNEFGGTHKGNRDRGIFGYMWDGSVVRNVSFLNVVTGDRCGVVANMVTSGALIENVYVEATVVIEGVNTNNTNPAGAFVQKVTAGGTVRNCVLNLTVNEGVKADVDSKNANAWAFRAAAFGQIAGTVDNVQVIYNPFEGQELPYSITGTATNSAIYANIAEFYAEGGADLTKYTDSGWHFEAGFMPYYGNMKPADLAITGESEVYQGNSVTLIPPKASTLSLKEAIDGVTLKGNTVTVDAAVAADTKITVVASSKYWADTCEFVITVKANAYALEMEKKSYSFTGFVGDELPTEELSYSLTMNGAAYDGEVTFESVDANVAIVEGGVLKAVGDGATKISMRLGDVDLGEISVSVELYNKVTTTEEFLAIGKDAASMAKKYMLMNDLDFEGTTISAFSCWHTSSRNKGNIEFKGVFDGNGYTLSNFTVAPYSGRADVAIFGYMSGNSAVRNVSLIDVKFADRGAIIANWMQDSAVVENVYIEATYTAVNASLIQATNPCGGIVAKMYGTSTVRNCIFNLTVAEGVTPSQYHGLIASMHLENSVIDNCQVIYAGSTPTALAYSNTGAVAITNSAIYANLDAFYAAEGGADLTKYTDSGWNFTAGLMPYYGTMKPANLAITGENEVYQGNSVTLNAPKACTLSLKDAIDGVSISGNTVTVGAAVAADTKITVVASSVYFADTCEFEITVKANAYALEMEKTDYSFKWANHEKESANNYTEALSYSVTLNGAAYDGEITFESANADVAIVENGVLKAVGNGTTTIALKAGGATLGTINVVSDMYTGVSTVADLNAINSNLGGKYRLMNDITVGGNFETIGCYHSGKQFTGVFDGNNHIIKDFIPVYNGAVTSNCGLFGTVAAGAVVKNLSVIGATLNGRISGGIAVQNNGLIENCFVQVTINYAAKGDINNPMGGAVSKQYGTMKNVIAMVTLGNAVTAENLVSVGALFGRSYAASVVENCYSISPATISTWESGTPTNDPKVPNGGTFTNVVDFDSLDAFYAAEGGANTSVFGNAWDFEEGEYPHLGTIAAEISVAEANVEIPVGMSKAVEVSSGLDFFVTSDTEGVTFANGTISVASTVVAGTTATITFTSVYDKTAVATITVTVTSVTIEVTTAVESISNDKAIIGVTPAVDLGAVVKVNDVATDAFEVKSSNTAVATVADGKVTIVGSGSANITVEYEGSVLLTVPVSAVAYIPVYDAEDFENCGNTAEARKLNYMLMNDIDFADEAGNPTEFHAFTCWNSAFDANTKVTTGWTGIFDGNGYALKNVIPSTDNRNSKYSSDASIFGIIDAKGVIRNLKVYARIEYRGGVVASLINSNGTIENCYVEATVAPTLADHTTSKPFGGIIFRSQKDGILQNNVAIITLEKNEAGTTAANVAVSGNVAVGYGKSYNNLSIVTTGETVTALTTTNATTVNTNNVCFVSYDAFFAAEGGADYSTYNTSVWSIDATNKTIGLIAGCSYKA